MKYGYVCTNYNSSKLTAEAVASLVSGKLPPARITIVDNVSRPDDITLLQKLVSAVPAVDIVLNPENVGYFRGLNVGIRRIRQIEPDLDCLVIGNNDLLFPAEFGEALAVNIPRLNGYPVISPDVVTMDGNHQNPHVIRPVGRFRELMYDVYHSSYFASVVVKYVAALTRAVTDRDDENSHEVAQSIHQGHGSVYILTNTFFENFEELWAPTFLLGEEYFLARQLEEKGMSVFYEPALKVRHHWHASIVEVPSLKMWKLSRDAHRIYRRYVKAWR